MARIGVGVDWGAQEHEVCALNEKYEELGRWRIGHDGESLARLATELSGLVSEEDELVLAIEVPDGPVVETMLERGFTVYSINPRQSDRFRERFRPSAAKDDRMDAWVLARTVLSDTDCFQRVHSGDPQTVALREWSRARDQGVSDRTRIQNRLTGLLRRYFPAVLDIGRLDEAWVQELLRRAPTPAKARRIQRRTIETLLKRHRIRRIRAEQVLPVLRQAPLVVDSSLVEVLAQRVVKCLDQLGQLRSQIRECDNAIDEILEDLKQPDDDESLSDAQILASLPGAGRVNLATVLSEAPGPIGTRNLLQMRALSGCAPVSILSGAHQNRHHKRRPPKVQMRRARSARLATAMFHWARVAATCSPTHKKRYAALRARGHTHGRACRQLGDYILQVAFAMLRDRTLYQPPAYP